MISLREANYEDLEKEWLFIRDMPEEENGMTNEWAGVSRETFEREALPRMIAHSKGEALPEGYVPQTTLFLWDDDRIAGLFRVRHYLNESLRIGAGHIGYCIGRKYRGRGYGTEGLRLTLEFARDIVPEKEFYLRLNRDNIASLRVMEKNGGKVVGSDDAKLYVRIKKPGSRDE